MPPVRGYQHSRSGGGAPDQNPSWNQPNNSAETHQPPQPQRYQQDGYSPHSNYTSPPVPHGHHNLPDSQPNSGPYDQTQGQFRSQQHQQYYPQEQQPAGQHMHQRGPTHGGYPVGQRLSVPHRSNSNNDLDRQYSATSEPDTRPYESARFSSSNAPTGYTRGVSDPTLPSPTGSDIRYDNTQDIYDNNSPVNVGSNKQDDVSDYSSRKSSVVLNKSKASKYGTKSSAAAMNQYSHRPPQEKTLHHIQDMKNHSASAREELHPTTYSSHEQRYPQQHDHHVQDQETAPRTYPVSSTAWQSTREQRRLNQGHSSVSAYRNLSENTSNLSINPTDTTTQPRGATNVTPSHSSENINEQPQTGDESSVEGPDDHDFVSWARLQDPYDISDALDRDPSLMTKTDTSDNSLLHGGAEVGNISLVDFLLKRLSAKVAKKMLHSVNKDGLNPLHVAIKAGMFHIIK